MSDPSGVSAVRRVASRTQAMRVALAHELERRQQMLDSSNDLVQVTVTLKLVAGTGAVRGVVWQEERLAARQEAGS